MDEESYEEYMGKKRNIKRGVKGNQSEVRKLLSAGSEILDVQDIRIGKECEDVQFCFGGALT